MKTNAFAYFRAETADEALRLFAAAGDGARYLAGGQSLMAALNFRLDEPTALIDISRIASLRGITVANGVVRIGALTRHADVIASADVAQHLPLVAEAIHQVAHPAIRNRGTFGGSIALADPAAEMCACALALDATMVVLGPDGERRVAASDWFLGLYETALQPGELLTAVEIPVPAPGAVAGFGEFARRHGDYAMAGLAMMLAPDRSWARVAFFGVSDRVVRSSAAEAALVAGRDAAAVAADGIDIFGDLNASEEVKRHYCAVLLRRALARIDTGARAA